MRRIALAGAAVAAFALLACSTVDSRIKANQELFDSYPPQVQANIRAQRIELGYTPEMVEMAFGAPARKSELVAEDGKAELWTYRRSKPGFGVGLGSASYGGGVGVGTGVSVGHGATVEDVGQVEFRNGRVSAFQVPADE